MISAFLHFRSNMARFCCAFVFLMVISFGYGFNCPDESGTFYYADVSVDCMVYHLCKDSEVTTFMCPFGLAFDHKSGKCKDASAVQCTYSAEEITFNFASTTEETSSNKVEKSTLIKHLKERLSKEGFLFVGKYFSTKGNSSISDVKSDILKKNPVKPLNTHKHSKSKRSVESNQSAIQDAMFQYRIADGLILPLVSEIMQDYDSKNDLKFIFLTARYAYLPLSYKMTRHGQFKDVTSRVSLEDIEEAKMDFLVGCGPTVRRIVDRHLFQILRRLSGNVPIVLEMIDRLGISSRYQVETTLKANVDRFVKRYSEVIRRSYNSEVGASIKEAVKRDFWNIETVLVQFFTRFLSESPGSLMKIIYNRNSVVYRMILG